MHCDGMWNELELQKKMKTTTINGAFWRFLKRFETCMSRRVVAHPSPYWPSLFICILFFLLSRKKCSFFFTWMDHFFFVSYNDQKGSISENKGHSFCQYISIQLIKNWEALNWSLWIWKECNQYKKHDKLNKYNVLLPGILRRVFSLSILWYGSWLLLSLLL